MVHLSVQPSTSTYTLVHWINNSAAHLEKVFKVNNDNKNSFNDNASNCSKQENDKNAMLMISMAHICHHVVIWVLNGKG